LPEVLRDALIDRVPPALRRCLLLLAVGLDEICARPLTFGVAQLGIRLLFRQFIGAVAKQL